MLLDSILKQTRKPIEIIIVDDTPILSIKLVCEQYEKAFQEIGVHLFYVKNPKERSICLARNFGARIAKGYIVQFVDSDVILAIDYLQEVQKIFEKHPEVLGVSGLAASCYGVKINVFRLISKLFFLFNSAPNSCKYFEFPVNVKKEIRCECFNGNAMAFKYSVFSEFQFDENLVKYSWMENLLFTGQINKTYPNRLILTPNAKCFHQYSNEGRMEGSEEEKKRQYLCYRKYVMTKLFGYRGFLMFGWQNMGVLFIKIVSRIRRKEKTRSIFYGI
jgi:cellulose synthase/poly-beta-1,6-N-acetylglucosamine synthase-like glycosyltransferase